MMLPLQEILAKYKLSPRGVIQVGCHWAEEHEYFLKCGIKKFLYIEPCGEAFMKVVKELNLNKGAATKDLKFMWARNDEIDLFPVACGASESILPMYVSPDNQGQSNSLLEPNLHLQQHPEVQFTDAEAVRVVPLDSLPFEKNEYGMLVMDVQGYEGEVLKGAEETLKHVNIIYSEVNRGQTYSGNMEIDEMDKFLDERGFTRVETHWPSPNWTWGDAVYIRKTFL